MSSLIQCLNITNSDLTIENLLTLHVILITELANNFKVSRTNRPTFMNHAEESIIK
jgi:hypothetical protein